MLTRSDAFMTIATEKLVTYALGRPVALLRYADRARDRAARGGQRQPVLVAGPGHHRERRVPMVKKGRVKVEEDRRL